jgi:ABC-2 type transport system ATP-binding protein
VKKSTDGSFRVELDEESAIAAALSFLVASGVTSIRTSRPSLEEVYVHIMGDRGVKV